MYEGRSRMEQKEGESYLGKSNCRSMLVGHSADNKNLRQRARLRTTDTILQSLLARELAEPESDGKLSTKRAPQQ